jgi:hypothetical protein
MLFEIKSPKIVTLVGSENSSICIRDNRHNMFDNRMMQKNNVLLVAWQRREIPESQQIGTIFISAGAPKKTALVKELR